MFLCAPSAGKGWKDGGGRGDGAERRSRLAAAAPASREGDPVLAGPDAPAWCTWVMSAKQSCRGKPCPSRPGWVRPKSRTPRRLDRLTESESAAPNERLRVSDSESATPSQRLRVSDSESATPSKRLQVSDSESATPSQRLRVSIPSQRLRVSGSESATPSQRLRLSDSDSATPSQ